MALLLLPIVAAIIGFIIGLGVFIGTCLLVIGGTSIAMNKIYSKQIKTENSGLNRLYNKSSIILGILFVLFPLGYVLYGVISSLSSK